MQTTQERPAEAQIITLDERAALVPYQPLIAQLAEVEEENGKLVFEYRSKAGEKAARSHIAKLRKMKSPIDEARKIAKADAKRYVDAVDKAARELLDRVEAMIAVHQTPIDEIEAERAKREDEIAFALDRFTLPTAEWMAADLPKLRAKLLELKAIKLTEETFGDQIGEAAKRKDASITVLEELIEDAIAAEARAKAEAEAREQQIREEAARKAAEAEEAERLRLQLEAERAQRAQEAAERARQEAEQRARDAEARAAELERQQAQRAPQAPQAQPQAKADASREAMAVKNREALADLISQGLTDEVARVVLAAIVRKQIRHVSITY